MCWTCNVQETNSKEKYLIGKYDIEVLTIPRFTFENIEIEQSETTTINILAIIFITVSLGIIIRR